MSEDWLVMVNCRLISFILQFSINRTRGVVRNTVSTTILNIKMPVIWRVPY